MNPPSTQAQLESDWALKLQKSLLTKTDQARSVVSPGVELKQLLEEMNYFKPKLVEAIQNKDTEKMIKYFDIVCNARARIAANNIRRASEQAGRPTDAIVKHETVTFTEECYKLYLAINRILEKQYGGE